MVLVRYLVSYEMFNLLYYVFLLNIKKIKKIEPTNKTKKRVIVLNKSAGIDDLISSQQLNNKETSYYSLNRFFLMHIYMTIFRAYSVNDAKIKSLKEPERLKKKYIEFLIEFFSKLKVKFKFDAFVGFNFNYIAEKGLQIASRELKIPFLLIYKEGIVTELEKKYFLHVLKKKKEKFNGSKIAVYSNDIKKILVNSGYTKSNKVSVVGCSRLIYSFNYQNNSPKEQIVYYAIQNDRGLPNRFINKYGKKFFEDLKLKNPYNSKYNWNNLHYKTIKVLIKFAISNPQISIIIKSKTGVKQNQKLLRNLPKNIKIYSDGAGHHLLKNSKVVIAWNTTSIFEGIAANRYILLPCFNLQKDRLKKSKQLILKLKKENYAYSEKDLYKQLNFFMKKKYNKNKLNNNYYSLRYYLGNADNNANIRLNNFLKKNI